MNYYYVPQNAWGALDENFAKTNGLYSEESSPCSPVALYCPKKLRLLFTHSDPDNGTPLSDEIVDWMNDGDTNNKIFVSAIKSHICEMYVDKINSLISVKSAESGPINDKQCWYCFLDNEGKIVWVDYRAPNKTEIKLPFSYDDAFPNIGVTMKNYIISNKSEPFVTSLNDKFFLLPPNDQA